MDRTEIRRAFVRATLIAPVFAIFALPALAQDASLCGPHEKAWFEALGPGGRSAFAVCSEPDDADPIGTIRAKQASLISSGMNEPRTIVVAEASGEERAAVFEIRRYTRPQTTYLKFSFRNDRIAVTIYDDYDNGETASRLVETPLDGDAEPAELVLRPETEPLSLMGLEAVVASLPYDE